MVVSMGMSSGHMCKNHEKNMKNHETTMKNPRVNFHRCGKTMKKHFT
jgi:hypothetical protein